MSQTGMNLDGAPSGQLKPPSSAFSPKVFGIGLAIVLAVAAIAAFALGRKDAKESEARSALFDAERTMTEELKAIAKASAPPAAAKVEKPKDPKAAKPKDPKAAAAQEAAEAAAEKEQADAAASDPRRVAFRKMDVDARLAGAVQKLSAVGDKFEGTSSGFEARMLLGNLYFDHGEAAKSQAWYEKAAKSAPNSFSKAHALSAVGYALEGAGKCPEAINQFQAALNLGEESVKGDALLATARCQEATKDAAKARATYDQVISQLPNTSYARTAELNKSQLE